MATATQEKAALDIDAHAEKIDELHQTLAATPGCDTEKLQRAVDKYKAAHQAFRDDALGCMN
jgi:hypothetical protein